MPPKAYRWVHEMEEVAATHAEDGGLVKQEGMDVFAAIAAVYKAVADETELGKEKTGRRKRGRTVEDVAEAMAVGLHGKRKKME